MASNSSTVKDSSTPSLVDASGYKFPPEDLKPGKLKLNKLKLEIQKANEARETDSGNSSPILPELDEKMLTVFPTGKPRETELEKVNCKHCKRPILKQAAAEHIPACLKAKQEKARKKKEARDAANRAKEKANGGDKDDNAEGETAVKGQKSAKKSAGEDGPKKGKKRKADGDDDKETKKKKKKDEPKAKVPKPKGPVDVEKQCGVILPNGAQCARSLTCKTHSMGAKRAVPGRSLPYDMLLQAYQKKNQARQQKAAIDANAPIHDDADGNGPIDSDEEKDAVMAGLARSRPLPLVTHPLISTRRRYHLIRVKEMLSQAFGGTGSGIFSPLDSSGVQGASLFQSDPPDVPPVDGLATESTAKPSASQQPQNKTAQAATTKKSSAG
ncbi:hypothetical protein VTO42DRAFT_6219 [Malbranchea cinnamomea]